MTVAELVAGFAEDAFVLVYAAGSEGAPGRVLRWGFGRQHLPEFPMPCPVPNCCGCHFHLRGEACDVTAPVMREGLARQTAFVYAPRPSAPAGAGAKPCLQRVEVEIVGRLRAF